ncbi:MAG: hypothetical protein JST54_27920 [Deltaproteobacteria bacterium]|nr:hypothetical protein [Deltaproteobacteria bacterium]
MARLWRPDIASANLHPDLEQLDLNLDLEDLDQLLRRVIYPIARGDPRRAELGDPPPSNVKDLAVAFGQFFEGEAIARAAQLARRSGQTRLRLVDRHGPEEGSSCDVSRRDEGRADADDLLKAIAWRILVAGDVIRARLLIEAQSMCDECGPLVRSGLHFETNARGLLVTATEHDAGPAFLGPRELQSLRLLRYPRRNLPPSAALARIVTAWALGPEHPRAREVGAERTSGLRVSGLELVATREGLDIWVDEYAQSVVLVRWSHLFQLGVTRKPDERG